MSIKQRDKSYRGNASQFFVAGELCRRGYAAVVTLGNTPSMTHSNAGPGRTLCVSLSGTGQVMLRCSLSEKYLRRSYYTRRLEETLQDAQLAALLVFTPGIPADGPISPW